MKMKKTIAGVLASIMFLSFMSFIPTDTHVQAKTDIEKSTNKFHYEQLGETAQSIYDGIYAMYEKGILKTGTQDYDLVANGHFSDEQLQQYVKNNSELMNAMDAARYAFYADYPEVFYVNFPKLTLRTTKGKDGTFHIYLGSGRYENYYIDGFSSEVEVDKAIDEFNARVNDIVDGANTLDIKEGKNKQTEQIKYVHNEIINNTSYRLEDTCFEGDEDNKSNESYLGTPYGVLVKKQGVCEGYARSFKAVMDKLGINCILVQGVHRYDSEVAVAHMWNYVEITETTSRQSGGRWYAVDATQDDPEWLISDTKEFVNYTQYFDTYGRDGFENEKYLLVGQLTMNERHFANEVVDAAGGYEFKYPVLEDNDYSTRETLNNMDGFLVKQKTITSTNGNDTTEFQISYRGMNVTNARKQGIYLLAKYYGFGEGEDSESVVPLTGWCYFSDSYALKEDENSVYIQEGGAVYMEFAATNVKPRDGLAGLTYAGDDFGIIARTGKIYNENQNGYIAPPFILKQTPTQTATIAISTRPYRITAVYDETLMLEEGLTAEDIGYRIKCKSTIGEAVSGEEYTKVTNITWDGDKTVEFDVAFSQMFADNSVAYEIFITGLVGEKSRKAPNPVTYTAMNRVECPSIQGRRGSWDIFGKPTLLENEDLSMNGWKMSNGKEVSNKLKDRLALVATKTTDKQEGQMQDALDKELPGASDKIIESSTYNITLTVCKAAVIKTGHKVRVRLGFPKGYGPNDEGVTFKAYHFKRDNQGNVTGVEEIDCVVTPYGLIITCDAFSPFTIAAVKKDEAEMPEEKCVIATTSDGGTITGINLDETKILRLSDGDSKTLSIKPNDGYEIESVTVCGKDIEITDKNAMDITVSYAAAGANNIVHANFVAKTVAQKEAERNEVPVKPIAEPAVITLPNSLNVSNELIITPTISATPGVQTYQWYKDGKKLDGKINRELSIQNVTENDTGRYQLQVTTTVDTVSAEVMSDICSVTVSEGCQHINTKTYPATPSTCTVQGHKEYTVCNDCKAVISGSAEKLPLAPHDNIEKAETQYLKSEATCSAKAVYFKSCSVCGERSDETFEYGKLKEHKGTVIRNDRAATCIMEGYTGDIYCEDCDVKIADGAVIPVKGHVLEKIEEKEAAYEATGNIEYYKCFFCSKLFKDAGAITEISLEDTIIPAIGIQSESTESNDSVGTRTPNTGDNSNIILWGMIAVLFGTVLCIIALTSGKKKIR